MLDLTVWLTDIAGGGSISSSSSIGGEWCDMLLELSLVVAVSIAVVVSVESDVICC